MKILQLVTKRQYRGAELFAADLSSELIKLGHSVAFVGLYKVNEDVLKVNDADNRDLIDQKASLFSILLVKRLVKLIKEFNPDVIQCNGSDTLKYTYVASYFVKDTPIVYRNISIISEWVSNMPKKVLYKKMFRRIAHVTSVGNEAMADFMKTYNYPKNKTEVIRRGIPIKNVDKLAFSKVFRSHLGLNSSEKIVTHVGNFSPEKNHEFLIDVFFGLKKEHPEIKLVCVGSGILFEKIKNLVQQRGLEKNVFLLGFRKDIPEILAASDCLILSSRVEGVPGVILEAGTQKTPSIANNVGGVSEVLINNKTGYLIKGLNVEEYRDKLIKLLKDNDLRDRFGENAYAMISEGFNPQENVKKFEKLYASLAGIDLNKTQPKLRILQIIQKKQLRGAEVFCCQLSNHLIRMGYEVEVYSIFDGESELPFQKEIKSLKSNQEFRYLDYKGWKSINEVINTYKPDLVQANAADTLKYTVFSKKAFGWKQPILYRNASVSSFYIKDMITKRMNSFLLKNVDSIISVSNFSRNDIIHSFPFAVNKTEVISIGVEAKRVELELVKEYQTNKFNLVHVGSLTLEKNHFELLEIFKIVLQDFQDIHLHLIGAGPLKTNISKKVKEFGIENNCSMYDEVKDPLRYIAQADILLLPSLIEGLPAVILESMYNKTPVIAYDVGGVSEIITKSTGFLIEQNDQKTFARSIVEVLQDRPENKIDAAFRLVNEHYINDKIAKKFIKIYHKIAVKTKSGNFAAGNNS